MGRLRRAWFRRFSITITTMVDAATGIVAICIVLATTTTAGTIITGGITIINHLRDRALPPVKRGLRVVLRSIESFFNTRASD